jgi:hypothetical protein
VRYLAQSVGGHLSLRTEPQPLSEPSSTTAPTATHHLFFTETRITRV